VPRVARPRAGRPGTEARSAGPRAAVPSSDSDPSVRDAVEAGSLLRLVARSGRATMNPTNLRPTDDRQRLRPRQVAAAAEQVGQGRENGRKPVDQETKEGPIRRPFSPQTPHRFLSAPGVSPSSGSCT